MTLELLKKSLELYLTTVTDETEQTQVLQSISECQEQIDRYFSRDIWNDTIYIISPNSLSDLLNISTYDEYGKLKKSNGDVTFEQYRELVNDKMFLDLTDSSIELGYDIISDLWLDNEEYENHNPDGTMRN